jgi:hypothetical protein
VAGEILASIYSDANGKTKLDLNTKEIGEKWRFGTYLEKAQRVINLKKLLHQEGVNPHKELSFAVDEVMQKIADIFKQLGLYPYPK